MKKKWILSLGVLFLALAFRVCLDRATPVRIYEGKGSSRLTYDREHHVLDIQVAADGRYRSPIELAAVPKACVDAALTYEDKQFYRHPGVNPVSLLRAAASVLGSHRVGGSTLTMQLARIRGGLNTKSASGKLGQIWEAMVLERHFSKQEILEAYFNFAPYGGGIEGIAAASAIYFDKIPRELSRAECAALAVLPQSPTSRFGFRGEDFTKAFNRLGDQLKIPASERSLNFPSSAALEPRHFARHLTARLLSGGGSVTTTIDAALQRQVEETLRGYVASHSLYGLRNGAVVVADGSTGEVLSYVGSRDFAAREIRGFVDGVSAKRSPGSLLKPFVYAKAIDEGLIVPDSMVVDVPIKLTSYEPENFEKNFLGVISAREALVKSRNIPALLLNSRLQGDGLYTFLTSSGIPLRYDASYYGAAVVIGGIEVTLLDVVRLYSALANRGKLAPIHAAERGPIAAPQDAMSAEAAYLTWEMLKTNPAPPGYASGKVAWKTGTSSGARDAWAAGVEGSMVVAVWLGNFDNSPNPNFIGRDLAGPLLFEIFERLRSNERLSPWLRAIPRKAGLKLKEVELCPDSGLVRTESCPHGKHALVVPGVSPIKTCDVHRSGESGVIAVRSSEVTAHLMEEGLQLGLRKAVASSARKIAPRIVSPERGVEYRTELGKDTELELRANLDGEAARVYWYVDGELVGDSEPAKPVFWRATPGVMTIRAVDSFGGSDAVKIKILPQEN